MRDDPGWETIWRKNDTVVDVPIMFRCRARKVVEQTTLLLRNLEIGQVVMISDVVNHYATLPEFIQLDKRTLRQYVTNAFKVNQACDVKLCQTPVGLRNAIVKVKECTIATDKDSTVQESGDSGSSETLDNESFWDAVNRLMNQIQEAK